jgi:hypothetical protein
MVVDQPVAVVVHSVAHLGSSGVDLGTGVVTVAGARRNGSGRLHAGVDYVRWIAESIAVHVIEPRRRVHGFLVDRTVAVVVPSVAHFVGTGEDRGIGVVTVTWIGSSSGRLDAGHLGRPRETAKPITVQVIEPGRGVNSILIDDAVAVVVASVTDLRGTGVDTGIGVVTVAGIGSGSGRLNAGHARRPREIAKPITIRVKEPRRCTHNFGVLIVNQAVAVVVQPVAHLRSTGVDRGIGVVTITVAGGESVPVAIITSVANAVAVSVTLVGIGDSRAVVACVADAVAVGISLVGIVGY